MKFTSILALGAGVASASPLLFNRQSPACFVIGNEVLPQEVSNVVSDIRNRITCNPGRRTLSGVPDVSSGGVSFSSVNFANSNQTPLQFALERFATKTPLATTDLVTFQSQLDVYLATEAGIRSVGGNLAIKVPKFYLQFQVSRIQTAQGNPPTAPGLQVDHLRDKVLKNAPREAQALKDQLTAQARQLS
ncbi:hypothetical protein V8F33_003435 [Rhypophila sp. PSN 637]